ncbi:C39 family peptidase [Luteolibacter pohnpeiensis]|uniref:C39 family peptidase n=1 Tax=Luteolibacter pohnpeiensis TaxID=454153 RepID=A0A934VVN6_9BACT|nr:C39 family peptidase [Luteolibacter pohnpeiensis]MBK1883747.1 C39 family peptidase [Luteolibacter pohnpeiensis]
MRVFLPLLFVVGLNAFTFAEDSKEDKKDLPPLDKEVFTVALWKRSLEDVKGPDKPIDEETAAIIKRMKDRGIDYKPDEEGFVWLSSAKNGLRAKPESFTLLEHPVGEVVIRGKDSKPVDVTISLYNRGDDGEIGSKEYVTRMKMWNDLLVGRLGSKRETINENGAVPIKGWLWTVGDSAVYLEGSENRAEKRPEFIRLRFASISAAKDKGGVGRRESFANNVTTDDKGFTFIHGVPMVDQGEKGYCVVATVERVARYYGANIDQHEMAQIADTGENGTNGDAMEKAFQRITGKIHLRTIKLIEFDMRQLDKDVVSYNRAVRAHNKSSDDEVKEYPIDPDDYYINPLHFWHYADKDIFRTMKAGQNGYEHFNSKIKEYVDQGIPLCWTLYLGMFPEKGLPQTYGGHMRLIIGYNEKTHEIYYTDSWGEGHECKTMRADEAYCMTMALYSMMPSQ